MYPLKLRRIFTHNLKGFDLNIPLQKLVVVTGPSGSGKSSLVFDTLVKIAENRTKLLTDYAKPTIFLDPVKAELEGPFPPLLALRQGVRDWYPYKTVGEILGIFFLIEYLFSQWGDFKCPVCSAYNKISSLNSVIKWFEELSPGEKFFLLLPLPEKSLKALSYLQSQGFTRFIINGKEIDLSEEEVPYQFEEVYLVLDRMIKEERSLYRLLENLRLAQSINRGQVLIKFLDGKTLSFNLSSYCVTCGSPLLTYFKKCSQCRGQGYKEKTPCPKCNGLKLESTILESKLFGIEIKQIVTMSLGELYCFWRDQSHLVSTSAQKSVLTLLEKATFWEVDYLSLSNPVFKLTLGERKILEILLLFFTDFYGVLYVLDEPTLGLDEFRRKKLLILLRELINKGNSCLVVEHDPEFIRQADFIIELGFEGGEKGGYLVRAVPREEYPLDSLKFPNFKKKKPEEERLVVVLNKESQQRKIFIGGINLFPLEGGSKEIGQMEEFMANLIEKGYRVCKEDSSYLDKGETFVIEYIGIWELWRDVLLQLPTSRAKGLTKRHFSFHTPEGICKGCKGRGSECEECLGKRLNYEVLNLTYRGYKIAEILDFTLEEALNLFTQIPKMQDLLLRLKDLKVSYLRLSQRLKELSGGERLRLNLIKKLFSKEKCEIYLLYYPFQGLSPGEWSNLHTLFRKLNQEDKTIVIVESHPLARGFVDWII
ncbi:MAG: hypothetical protein NZ850_02970 [Caldimicrobium sp.]|nr:hypothetical protein [Caldimicrobium sp.]